MKLRFWHAVLVALGAPGGIARAQAVAGTSNPIGIWRGTSLCLVQPSSCHDEVVVYRITRGNASDSLTMDARRIANAREEEMGVLGCRLASQGASFACTIPNGVWHFTVRRDSLVGELRLLDSTRFRDVRAARSR